MLFNADDLHDLSDRLSGDHGTFPSSNLVSYGQTAIVRPGSRTFTGVLLSGEAVADLLGEDFEVFPATLTYAPDVLADGLDRVPVEVAELESALDALDDADDAFGAKGAGIRRRYKRVVARFRRFAARAESQGKPAARRNAKRLWKRMRRIYRKMEERGISTRGLPSPRKVARQVRSMKRDGRAALRSTPMVPNATPFDLRTVPAIYGVEAEEADEELLEDARAETMGYLFGSEEHDYFGIEEDVTPDESDHIAGEIARLEDRIEGEDPEDVFGAGGDAIRARYEKLANRYRRFAAKAYRKGTPALRAKAERLLSRVRKIYLKMQEKGLEVEGLTTPDDLAQEAESFVLEAEVSTRATPLARRRKRAAASEEDGEDEEEGNPDEDAMGLFGYEGTPFDFVDAEEEIVFGLERVVDEVRAVLGMDDDLADDDFGEDDEDDDDAYAEDMAMLDKFLSQDDDDDDDDADLFGEDEDEADEEEDEGGKLRKHGVTDDVSREDVSESRLESRAARASRRAARSERDAARFDLQRLRAERKADRIAGDEDEGDEDAPEDEAPEGKKSRKGKPADTEKEKDDAEKEDTEQDGDLVASQRSKLSRAIKQVNAVLADKESAKLMENTRGALEQARGLLSALNVRARKGSKNGGIDYGRLRPVDRGSKAKGITVTAIRRRIKHPEASTVQSYASTFGLESDGHVLDVFATDFLDRSEGFDALESMAAIRDFTGPNDFVYGDDDAEMGARLFKTRGRELREGMPGMRSGKLLKIAANPYRSRRSRREAMRELRGRQVARMGAEDQQAEEIGYLFVTRGRELIDQMPELRSFKLYNVFRNPYRSERVRREALQELAARYAEDSFGEDYGRMFRVRGRRAVALVPQARSSKLLSVASNPYRSDRVRAAAAAELAERHAAKQGLPAPVVADPNPAAPQVVVQPTPITPTTAPTTSALSSPPAPAPVYVPAAAPAQPSAAYFQDQEALEREVAAALPSYYGSHGSYNAQPFPYGDASPLPPPRRTGPEVFA